MTDVDEHLLTAGKIGEQAHGELEGALPLLDHAGVPTDPDVVGALTFLDQVVRRTDDVDAPSLQETAPGELLLEDVATDAASEAIRTGDTFAASRIVGITEQDLRANQLLLASKLVEHLKRDDALTTMLAAGDPNCGKTNTVWLCVEVCRAIWPDLVVISNAKASCVDERVTSAYELADAALEHRDEPMAVIVDEGSTHYDSRTNAQAVAEQWSPLHKHFSKMGVQFCAVIGHTGKDVVPEVKRMTSLALYKPAPDVAEFYANWPDDADHPTEPLFSGPVEELQQTTVDYDPDSRAPWTWDLPTEPFEEDFSWSELHSALKAAGPA